VLVPAAALRVAVDVADVLVLGAVVVAVAGVQFVAVP
jgi:hypothetical protein